MKILKITNQCRRDFSADMICEHCHHIENNVSGYDDEYYHSKVLPKKKCPKCGKVASEDYRPQQTKYAEHEIV